MNKNIFVLGLRDRVEDKVKRTKRLAFLVLPVGDTSLGRKGRPVPERSS